MLLGFAMLTKPKYTPSTVPVDDVMVVEVWNVLLLCPVRCGGGRVKAGSSNGVVKNSIALIGALALSGAGAPDCATGGGCWMLARWPVEDSDYIDNCDKYSNGKDGEGEEEGEQPCEDHDAVIPSDVPNNKGPRNDSRDNKDGSEDESGRGDRKDGGPAIGNASIVGGGRVGHVEVGA
ncbi:hypothetical protein HG530_013359 [Fusarium avenaceum]|nr:hypothetical protein HG530_013359 [Fusarium avenaceum]